jgi:hypothetical protein
MEEQLLFFKDGEGWGAEDNGDEIEEESESEHEEETFQTPTQLFFSPPNDEDEGIWRQLISITSK